MRSLWRFALIFQSEFSWIFVLKVCVLRFDVFVVSFSLFLEVWCSSLHSRHIGKAIFGFRLIFYRCEIALQAFLSAISDLRDVDTNFPDAAYKSQKWHKIQLSFSSFYINFTSFFKFKIIILKIMSCEILLNFIQIVLQFMFNFQ